MEIEAPTKKVSIESIRESLIAISYSLPEKVSDSHASPQSCTKANGVAVMNGDDREKYRSKLISISYLQSPETTASPAAGA